MMGKNGCTDVYYWRFDFADGGIPLIGKVENLKPIRPHRFRQMKMAQKRRSGQLST
jgi:hypothetical protein